MEKVVIAFTCKVRDIMSSWMFFFWNRLIVIIDSKCAILWTGAVLRSLINDATIESKKIGAYLCEESCFGAYLVLIALVLARELFIPITGHYDKKYSSLSTSQKTCA